MINWSRKRGTKVYSNKALKFMRTVKALIYSPVSVTIEDSFNQFTNQQCSFQKLMIIIFDQYTQSRKTVFSKRPI